MSNVTEFVGGEVCTAVMTLPLPTGESFDQVSFGYYPESPGEVWIEHGGARLNIPEAHIRDVMKQLKRAQRLEVEQRIDNGDPSDA